MASHRVSNGKDRPGDGHPTQGAFAPHTGASQLHVTAGGILSPVIGFSGTGITGTPPAPKARGFTNEPGDGNLPSGKRKAGGNNALKAFGLQGSGQSEK
jgi:hypothetical protein